MKVLLTQLPTSHLGAGEIVYPIGLARLSTLIPEKFKKKGLDMNIEKDPWKALKRELEQFRPDVVLLSFRNIDPLAGIQASYLPSLETAAKMIRIMLPCCRIIAGGPAFSLFGKRLMQMIREIDFGVAGDGEKILPHLLELLIDVNKLPGLLFRVDETVVENKRSAGMSLSGLPKPDVEYFSPASYIGENKYVAAIGIEGKRGCDLKCAYCVYPAIGGFKTRLRPPKEIADEIEFFHHKHQADLFHFTDSVVNRPCDHFEAVMTEIVKRKLNISWTGFFREDTFTRKTADLCRRSGLAACYFSADALTDMGLQLLQKRLSKDDIFNASRITADNGILSMNHFLVNLPFETPAHVLESKETMARILDIYHASSCLGAVIFNNVRLYPNAALTKKLIKENVISRDTDFLYPVYFNPQETAHIRFELEAMCHMAGTFSRFGLAENKETLNADMCAGTPENSFGKTV